MRHLGRAAVASAAAALLVGAVLQPAANASPPSEDGGTPGKARAKSRMDDLPDPKEAARRAERKLALEKVLRGKAKVQRRGDSKVVKLGKDRYAQLSAPKTDQLFSILCEFGDKTDPRTGGQPGPRHNQIPEPDRRMDNSTYWEEDFDRQHYMDMFFGNDGESFADFYLKQSSGRYTVTGDVSSWVQVPYNEARYGSNEIPSSDGYWNFVRDCSNAWYDKQKASGKTDAEIEQYLSRFDEWDRFDYDGDGNFDERDGYVDHIQLIHAGEGEEAGGGAQGADAIWSHRWAAFNLDPVGPEFNENGGTEIGDSGLWVRDYTTEPENGGLGVFTHEYGHDLGLPDLYDTAGGDNGTGFWTLMSSGSWLGHGKDTTGTTPGYMGAWEKLQLGWLDYEVASHDVRSKHTLGLAERTTEDPQALVVVLPRKRKTVEYNTPASGQYEWWSGSDDELNNHLATSLDLTGKSSASLTAKAWYDIEKGYDFALFEVSTDGGQTWERLGDPLTGSSDGAWTDLTYDLSAYAGQQVDVRYRYLTDGAVHHDGLFLDDFVAEADGETVFSDDVESGEGSWDANGFTRMTGTTSEMKGRYYLVENRQYVDYDSTLQTGPYNSGRVHTKPNWRDHYPYQNGLLVWYWNGMYEDNNTSQHPGHGLVLPVDANPEPIAYNDGSFVNGRGQAFDATFGLERTDPVRFSKEVKNGDTWGVVTAYAPERKGVRVFDDSDPDAYWSAKNPGKSTKVAGLGMSIRVHNQAKDASTVDVAVRPAR